MSKKLTTKQLYYRVYRLVLKGIRGSEISRKLGYDKGYISRVINRLVAGGYLVCINPQSRCKFYEATKKPYKLDDKLKLFKTTPIKSQQLRHRRNVVKIQKSSFKSKVFSPPKEDVNWDKEYNMNGVHVQQYTYPFENIGDVKFRRFIGKDEDSLLIILPSVLWERDAGDPEDYLLETAGRCGSWFMKRFKAGLEDLQVCQKSDKCLALTDPKLIHLAQTGSYNYNGMMINTSAPDCTAEVEFKDWDDLISLSECPKRISILEYKVDRIEKSIDNVAKSLDRIEKMFDVPNKPDCFRDVV